MGRDLFAEAGIVPDSAVEGRDLFAEAGLVPDAPPAKRPIGALEAFGRSMGDSIAAVPDFLNEAAAALLRPVDGVIGTDIAGALTRPTGPVKQARTAYKLNQQTEQLDGTGAQLAHGVGPLPRDIIAAIMTSGLSAAPAATLPIVDTGRVAAMKALVPELQQGAKAMMVPGALSSRDAYNEARVAGADPMQAAALGTVRGVGTVAQGALPMAKAGNMATRVASGVPLAVLPNRVQLQAENLVAPESMQHQPTLTDDASAAIPGMLLAALLGPRAGRIQTPAEISNIRRTDNMNKWGIDRTDGYGPELAPVEPSAPRAPEPYAADPYAVNPKQATADLNEKLFPAPDESPDLKLVPKVGDGALFSTKSNPDPASIPSRLTLEGDGPNRILADSDVRNIEKVLGMSEAEVTALPRPAQEALRDHANSFAESKQSFDLADRRQRQADADLANRGQIDPDYQGGGAAARFGKFNQGARPVTLLDGVQDVTRFASKDGITTVEYTDEQGTTHRLQVEESRLRDVVISANQRMDTQDFNARSSEPPSAVGRGTMASENMPRRSTDRIAGDQYGGRATPYNPNPLDGGRVSGDVLPPDAGTDVVPGARREGDTVNGETLRPFDAPNEQRQIGAPPRQIGERSRFATDGQGRTVDRENRQPMTGEGRPLTPKQTEQTTNDKRTNDTTNEQIQKATEAVKAEAQGQEQPAADVGITASEKLDQIQARMASRQTPNEAARAINEKAVAPAKAPKAASDIPPQASQLLADIRKRGGIDPKEALDLTGDNAFQAGQRMRGVFKKGGMSADGLLEMMQQRQWLGPDATIAEARAMVNDAFNRREITAFDGLSDNVQAREAAGRWQEHQERMASDPEYRAEQERLSSDVVEWFDVLPAPKVIDEADLATEYVTRFGEDALEYLAIKHVDSADNFYNALRSELNGQAPKPEESRASGENQSEANQGSLRREAPESDFALEQHGDAELRQRERDRAEAGRAERALAAEVSRKERAAQNRAEQERRAAEVLKEREEKKKAEVDAAVDDFALGQAAPKPVEKRVSTEDARGQQNVFDQPAPQASEKLNLRKDGIDGYEIPWDSVANGNEKFQYAIGRTAEDGETAVFRRRADERGTYGGWRWEASKQKASANPERNLFEQQATTNPADAKPVAPEVSAKISSAMRKQQGGFIDPNVFGLTKIADAISKAWDFSFGDAKAHADRLYDISKTLKAVADKTADFRASPIRHIWEMTLETMQGTQRGIQRRNKSETYRRILDQFSAEAGADRAIGETYDAAVQVHTNQYLNRLQKTLDTFQRDNAAMQQIVRRVRSGSFDNSPAGKAAKEVAALLKDAHDYMKAAGVEIGEIKNGYYPREFDKQLAMKNPTGFRDALEFEYRKTMPPADAKLAAQRLADTIMYGDTTTMFKANGGQVRTPWAKERVFSKDVDNASHPLNKFLEADAMDNLTRYLQSAVRRAEVSRRFGDKFFNFSNEWKDAKGQKQKPLLEQLAAEGAQADIGSLQDFVATMAGLRTSGVSDRWMTASSSLRTWTSLMMLSKATLSSLSEFITPAIRAAGSTSNPFQLVPDAARMLQWTLADVMHKSRSASAKERRAIADDLGLIAGTHSDMMTAARWSGGDDFSKAQSLTLSNFFSRTYLTQWTEHTRVAATEMGRVFIRRIAKQAGEGDKLAARYLREIGVSDANMKGFTEWVGKTNDGMPSVGDFQGAHGTTYRTALHRFVEQSIMVPTKGTKPGWMNSPQGAVIGQLNSFNYAFYENVVKRNMKLAKGAWTEKDMTKVERIRMAYPLLSMPALVAVAYAIGEMRDEVLGDPDRRKTETGGEKILKAASRGAPIAPLDPFLNYYTAVKFQRPAAAAFAGPGLGAVFTGMDATRNLVANNKDTTNTAERQFAKAAWGTLIEPGLQLGLSRYPVAPAYAIMTQVVGSGGTQAAVVDAVAGEDTRKKKQQRQW